MGRPAKASYSEKYGCWVTAALGETRRTKTGRTYRPLTLFKDLTHPTRDELAAQARLHRELERSTATTIVGDDITFEQLTEFYLEEAEKSGRLAPESSPRSSAGSAPGSTNSRAGRSTGRWRSSSARRWSRPASAPRSRSGRSATTS